MEMLRPPPPLSLTGNLAENWRKWEQRFNLYLTASALVDESETRKIAVLLHSIGEEALDIYNSLEIEYEDSRDKKLSEVLAALRKYCAPRKNTVFERHQFWAHTFSEQAGIDKFLTELRNKARTCEFGGTEDLMIRDKIVFSITDSGLRERLLSITELTLSKAIDMCRAKEVTRAQVTAMAASSETQFVHAVTKNGQQPKWRSNKPAVHKQMTAPTRAHSKNCGKCGRIHMPRQCPAYNEVCKKCGKKNHFALVCKSKPKMDALDIDTEISGIDALFVGSVVHSNTSDTGWHTKLTIAGTVVNFKLDTGAEANVIPKKIIDQLQVSVNIQKTNTVLVSYGGTRIKPEGVVKLHVHAKNKTTDMMFFVTTASDIALLGRQACVQLDLIRKVDALAPSSPTTKTELLSRYASVFQGLGQFPGLHHIHTDPSIPPVIHGCRKIPYAVHDRLKETLDDLEKRGVISKVSKPTAWVSSLCITEKKNGALRVCLDPRDLNKAILRQHYNIPTLEDIRSKLAGKTLFTILDEKDGYWQIQLDEESADLCAFNTPWGRYRFHRMPFGIKSASEVFQRLNSESFGDIEGVFMVADDMIIAASTKAEHDVILEKVMNRALSLNVKFNKDKLQYMVNEVTYLGHVITTEGVKPDESKVSAILQFPPPTDRKALQRLLGMTRYLSQYIPNEATLTAPLRLLLRKDIDWQWHPEQQLALEKLRTAIATAPVLGHFDPKEPIEVQADASKDGLGAALMQKQQPIAYASRALSAAEKNYAQIEKELLAIVFALRKFHQHVYGVPIRVQSDHKPLEAIFSKPIGAAPARLQRMLLQLQRYDIHIVYTPGNQMHIADTLSRAYIQSDATESLDLSEEKVVYALNGESPCGNIMHMIQQATQSDPELQLIQQLHEQGWPDRKKNVPLAAQAYWPVRHTISIDDELLMKDDRIIVPRALRPEVLKRLHAAHQGIQRSLAHARSCFYWPGLTKAVRQMVEACSFCQESRPENQKEPLISHPVPTGPWQKIAADIFDLQGRSFLLIVDYFSKYPEVLKLSDKTSASLIAHFKTVFARHGVPETLIADHVPFASAEMARFALDWGFNITHSSPNFPQSNGMAERAVKTVKSMLKTAAQSGTDPHLALLTLRNTPVTGLKYSPAQILMGRVLRSTLPASKAVLQPSIPTHIQEALQHLQSQQKRWYDRTAAPLPAFKGGQRVYMRIRNAWKPATVVSIREEPRSYDVVTSSGTIYRRNRRHLRPDRSIKCDSQPDCSMDTDNDLSNDTVPNLAQMEPPQDMKRSVQRPEYTRAGRIVRQPARFKDYVLT
uniref:Gypsy retrotransposon integrase-like protein 1 n=1 Tax=Cyprinus carpio TaxID=7962 RepID=A0A8C1X2E4_CYPCA